jgi:alanyl-tRNA synthetase
MLGNFSFGDYFKEKSIYFAWELLTKELCLPKEKLYVTVYHDDEEALSLWQKIAGLPSEKIIRISSNDNFWSMGDTGPCGPCSEIFYDHGPDIYGGLPGTPEEDGDRYVEIWNLVFMQYEQLKNGDRIALPQKSVDTGMGLERVTAVLQGVSNNYDIDIFKDLISHTESILKVSATGDLKFSYRVIADHIRSMSFLIADGVTPSNEGRGYVLRRIMRRAMRHAYQLGSKEPLMYKILPKLVELMSSSYPELKKWQDFISSVLYQEESRFQTTLENGLKILAETTQTLTNQTLPGDVAFKLYDTYGFPLDLTQDILKDKNVAVDIEGFNLLMQEQKQRARASWAGSGMEKTDDLWFDFLQENPSTEFVGYSNNSAEAIAMLLIDNGKVADSITDIGKQFILVTNQTPFYGESGGQMGDIGTISGASCKIKVINTQKYLNKIHAHICILESGKLSKKDILSLSIDLDYRKKLRSHHTCTHILHAVLRDILGNHVSQKGSLVAHDRLRFDISHPAGISRDEIQRIEDSVNQIILSNFQVATKIMPIKEAVDSGALALFGEKYEEDVRVVSIKDEDRHLAYSIELCGGTHVNATGEIGLFKITSEQAVAAGVRRIEGVCGTGLLSMIRDKETLLQKSAGLFNTNNYNELPEKIDHLLKTNKNNEQKLEKILLEQLLLDDHYITNNSLSIDDLEEGAKIIMLYKQLPKNTSSKIARQALELMIKEHSDLIIVFSSISDIDQKQNILIGCSPNIHKKYVASLVAKNLSSLIVGKGGGNDTIAQIGCSVDAKITQDVIISSLRHVVT